MGHIVQQLEAEVQLPMPEVDPARLQDVQAAVKDTELVQDLEQTVLGWTTQLAAKIAALAEQEPEGMCCILSWSSSLSIVVLLISLMLAVPEPIIEPIVLVAFSPLPHSQQQYLVLARYLSILPLSCW